MNLSELEGLSPDTLLPALRDLGIDAAEVASGPADVEASGTRHLLLRAPSDAAAHGRDVVRGAGATLSPDGALLLLVPSATTTDQLAAWRNALWPLCHVTVIYRIEKGAIERRLLHEVTKVEGEAREDGLLLAGWRREYALSPDVTVEKFDQNAPGWNGDPGSPGYPHFRWMRRHVACFAPPTPGARILDFGCGAGWVGIEAAKRSPGARLDAFDPSPEMVRIATANARAEKLEAFRGEPGFGEEPPFPKTGEEPYDLVYSSGVVSFAPDTERWLDGLAATVKPGGTLVIGDVHRESAGMRRRRREKPILPVREMNARTRDEILLLLEVRGFTLERAGGYQLTTPVPQAMHVNETKLGGVLTWPLLWTNVASSALAGARGQRLFDSWVMRLSKKT